MEWHLEKRTWVRSLIPFGMKVARCLMIQQPTTPCTPLEADGPEAWAAQIAAGASAVQLFDTWVGELTQEQYREFAMPATQLLIEEIGAGDTPVILYTKASSHLLSAAAQSGANVLSVDWRVDLASVRQQVGPRVALQGNLDPCVLLGPEHAVRRATAEAVERTGGIGHILNLGHGILPETPVENVMDLTRLVQEYSALHLETAKPEGGSRKP